MNEIYCWELLADTSNNVQVQQNCQTKISMFWNFGRHICENKFAMKSLNHTSTTLEFAGIP